VECDGWRGPGRGGADAVSGSTLDTFDAALQRALLQLRGVARYVAWFCGAVLFAAVALILFEVVGRRLLGMSVQGADELCGYALAISMAWGYGAVLLWRGHLRVDVLYLQLPVAARRFLDVASSFAFTVFAGFFLWRAAMVLGETLELGSRAPTPLATPLWLPQSLWLTGLAFLLLCSALITAQALVAYLRRDHALLQEVAGTASEHGADVPPPPAA
jgi:TRAP-type C4-dicarboxylate transport system permease small subunit